MDPLPKIGLGTWMLTPAEAEFSTKKAIEIGYRMIDTAQVYNNEEGVGAGLRDVLEHTQIKRKDLIVATKIGVFNLKPSKIRKSADISFQKLQLEKVEYVDLLYVHWPASFFGYRHKDSLKEFSLLVDEGKVKHICVSNFSSQLVEEAVNSCDKPIFADQVEHHPLLQQRTLREYLTKKQIHLVAYSPLARGHLSGVPELESVAQKHKTGVAQVTLAWLMHHNAIPIPKATSEAHLRNNFEALKLQLTPEDIAMIDGIRTQKRFLNPPVIKPKKWD